MTSSTCASRTTIVVLRSARTSLSNRKLRFAARAITSNTVRKGTSFSSREMGLVTELLSWRRATAGLVVFSSISRCSWRASR